MEKPKLSFDYVAYNLVITFPHSIFPGETGLANISSYVVETRTYCASSGVYSSWTPQSVPATSATATIPFKYSNNFEYHARTYAVNCMGNGIYSDVSTILAPPNPNPPVIVQVSTSLTVTAGGSITLFGQYLGISPSVYIDGSLVPAGSVMATNTLVVINNIAGGYGTHYVTIRTSSDACDGLTVGATWSYPAPVVLGTTSLSTKGGALTIFGANFGNNISVAINNISCSGCVKQSDYSAMCSACPPGVGTDNQIVVAVSGILSAPRKLAYASCFPMCIHGACVGDNVCECDVGYTGNYCDTEQYCAPTQPYVPQQPQILRSMCGVCNTGVCCHFKKE
jgi:hypothetical protein